MHKLKKIPIEWDHAEPDDILETGTISFINFLGKKLFNEYEPSQFQLFENQLINWLNNVENDDQQKLMLALLAELFFVGRKEIESLYRTTRNGIISRWIIDICNLKLLDDDIDIQISNELDKCWICPITDSLRINSFLKVNNIVSKSYRPDWRSLEKFADLDKINKYIAKNSIKNLILLEDFIGSGSQAVSIAKFAGDNFPTLNVL